MKAQGAWIQGALAVVGLGVAWATWQREPTKTTGDVVVLDATKNTLGKLRYDDGKGGWVELWREREGAAAGPWVKLSAKADSKVPERELRAGDAADKYLDGYAPLRAARGLGSFDEAKLREFGLAAPLPPDGGTPPAWHKRTLAVSVGGDNRTFSIGTAPGGYGTYLRDERDGQVFVVANSLLTDLEAASTRMVDRALHAFKAGDFDGVLVDAGGKRRELVVLAPDQPQKTQYASRKSPDKPDETAKNWLSRVFGIFPVEMLGKGEKPASGEPQIVAKVTWSQKGAEKGWVELARVQPATPAPAAAATSATPTVAPPTPAPEFYVRSERTAGWSKLGYGTDELLKEAEKIAAAE